MSPDTIGKLVYGLKTLVTLEERLNGLYDVHGELDQRQVINEIRLFQSILEGNLSS